MVKNCSYSNTASTFRRLAAFYRWALRSRLVLLDPTQGLLLSRPAEKLLIVSKTQFEQLNSFVRDANVPVDQALAVTLVLFFGFTTADLACATVEFDPQSNPRMKVILARKPRTRGRRYYNREQILKLPGQPPWIAQLAQRFERHWQVAFEKLKPKITFPKTPLFLDPELQHNRNLSEEYIRSLIQSATRHATGVAIPPRVLRQTCGHIMTRGDDASALAHLGWSPQFAFHYTWLPKVRFQPTC